MRSVDTNESHLALYWDNPIKDNDITRGEMAGSGEFIDREQSTSSTEISHRVQCTFAVAEPVNRKTVIDLNLIELS